MINYQSVLSDANFIRALGNSALVSGVTVLLALSVGSFAAYALGRIRFQGRTAMLYAVLSMTMFPQISVLSGLFAIVKDLGVFGSPLALIISYPIFTLPFTVWVLTSFFRGLPGEIEQAAYVDGATTFQTFYMISAPLTAPALVTTGLLAFISAWNEYLFALTFTITDPGSYTDACHRPVQRKCRPTGTDCRSDGRSNGRDFASAGSGVGLPEPDCRGSNRGRCQRLITTFRPQYSPDWHTHRLLCAGGFVY